MRSELRVNEKNEEVALKKRMILFLVIFALMVIPVSSAAAAGEIQPFDPGAGSSQDASIKEALGWMIRQPVALSLPICSVVAPINRVSLDVIARSTGNYGYLPFTGFDASLTRVNSSAQVVFSGSSPLRSDLPLPPPPSYNCDSLLAPGIISLTATKDAPNNPVVVGQDPNRGGVDLTWILNIFPTVYTYGIWEVIPWPEDSHCKSKNSECKINQSGKPCCAYEGLFCDPRGDQPSGNGICSTKSGDWNNYGCVDHTITYEEDIATLTPQAILTDASRNWILHDLARAYPGSFLKHPDWGFQATELCIWQSDHTCLWTHTEGHVQVADPGWYDLMITGITAGTTITPPRSFVLTGGHFGVNLLESSITGQP